MTSWYFLCSGVGWLRKLACPCTCLSLSRPTPVPGRSNLTSVRRCAEWHRRCHSPDPICNREAGELPQDTPFLPGYALSLPRLCIRAWSRPSGECRNIVAVGSPRQDAKGKKDDLQHISLRAAQLGNTHGRRLEFSLPSKMKVRSVPYSTIVEFRRSTARFWSSGPRVTSPQPPICPGRCPARRWLGIPQSAL